MHRPTIEDIILAGDTRHMTALRTHLSPTFVTDAARAVLERPGAALIITGFYIRSAGAPETDGPPGAAALGLALAGLGYGVSYVTDVLSHRVVQSVADRHPVIDFPVAGHEESASFARRLLDREHPSLVVAIERPGLVGDGTFRNVRGEDLSAFNAKTDYLFRGAPCTIGIGDGGNELGMGTLHEVIRGIEGLPRDPCVTAATHLIVAAVSNWGAFGLVAALSRLSGLSLLPTVEQGEQWVSQIVDEGAVDGVSAVRKNWVDGRSPEQDSACLRTLHDWLRRT